MSLLSQIHIGKQASPRRCMIHGVQGVGKSTFGATARNPIFIQTEDGLGEIDWRH
jgi:polynucleotide 5'-kinase involved in rRNA processing